LGAYGAGVGVGEADEGGEEEVLRRHELGDDPEHPVQLRLHRRTGARYHVLKYYRGVGSF